jgi:NOL1/NOP2/sun family putative RNA methylase
MSVIALPEAFVARVLAQFEEATAERILTGLDLERGTAFRLNRLMTDPGVSLSDVIGSTPAFDGIPPFEDAGWIGPDSREILLQTEAYLEHRIYVQNPASMIPVVVLAPEPGERVLDLAAAPGSKTLQIAEAVGPDGEVAAVDMVRKRFFRLKANLEANGATNVRTYLQDGSRVWRYRPEYFDRVLLDAPCSSEGRFQVSDPDSYRYWSSRKVIEMSRKQKMLLHSAVQCLRPGGILVYSTCSLSLLENEAIIDRLLRRFRGKIETVAVDLEFEERVAPQRGVGKKLYHEGVGNAFRILPSVRMEGFFVCKLRKTAPTAVKRSRGKV